MLRRYGPRQPEAGHRIQGQCPRDGSQDPCGIAFDSAGNLLVAEQQGGGVKRLTLKDQGDTVCG